MKLKMYFALLAMGMIGLQSCSNDDDDDLPSSQVPEAIRNAFDSSFSNTANLSWETKTVSKGRSSTTRVTTGIKQKPGTPQTVPGT